MDPPPKANEHNPGRVFPSIKIYIPVYVPVTKFTDFVISIVFVALKTARRGSTGLARIFHGVKLHTRAGPEHRKQASTLETTACFLGQLRDYIH